MVPLVIIGLLVALVAAITSAVQLRGRVERAPLGWMSERWLLEYRASHPS